MNATVKKSSKAPAAAPGNAGAAGGAVEKPAGKTASGNATASHVATPATSSQAGKRSAPATKVATVGASERPPVDIQSGKPLSIDNAKAGLQDRIDKTVVSKVSEVATKTPKAAPVIITDGALLSEAQLTKMGEKDYMNAAQLAFFKARLQQLERDLLKNAGETTEHLRETVLVPDPADRATIEEEHALELRTRDRERKLLKKVQQSIASIDTGDYGWCEETGEPIGVPRLLARPTATLSLEAQQRRELKQKLYGD